MPLAKLEQLERWVHPDLQPDLTVLFDIPVEVARQRLLDNARPGNGKLDRFEQEQTEFFNNVRHAYLERYRKFPARFALIDAAQRPDKVKLDLQKVILPL